ncbi:hypothetical protein B0T10DRAFT_465657 [Thelonectria olida]|uniref:Uncharacterized protein n=1 Tax=Thelonectria olida TaxID=1576542 RepID=A0A9P8VUG6_9HYPO|nr:hypothetical protein B0T10DRAFT_465657 [Thelonectria olida]
MECLGGLEALVTPVHAQFVNVLQTYIQAAVEHKDFDEATAQAHKSYNDHRERLGPDAKKVWQCLAKLGNLYQDQGVISQAFHMLRNARQGLHSVTSENPEEAYNCVRDITNGIIVIAIKQRDFDEAENESLSLIKQAEELGEAYQGAVQRHKHNLAHLYQDDLWRNDRSLALPPPNRTMIEKPLLEFMQFKGTDYTISYMQPCSWNMLRELYESTGQRSKLELLLPKLEDAISSATSENPTHGTLYNYKEKTVGSFITLGQLEKAEWWLLRLRDEVQPRVFSRLSITMQLGRVYFRMSKPNEAESCLIEAQGMAKKKRFSQKTTAFTQWWHGVDAMENSPINAVQAASSTLRDKSPRVVEMKCTSWKRQI